jgi:hypothetical protein
MAKGPVVPVGVGVGVGVSVITKNDRMCECFFCSLGELVNLLRINQSGKLFSVPPRNFSAIIS